MRLIYLMGASGSGKDSLLRFARQRLAGEPGLQFAHRYITRPANDGSENHVALTVEEFETRRQAGLFAMWWRGNGLAYGIGIEIEQWLAKGITVVVNGSRAYLPQAQARYPALLPVWIDASPATLRSRLLERGRESAAEVEARLARYCGPQPDLAAGVVLDNNGDLATAGNRSITVIHRYLEVSACA